jgi:predicted lipoprotein with Yx(FWY)xxD motif
MKMDTSGFRLVRIILIFIIVGALGFVAYRAYAVRTDKPETVANQQSHHVEQTENESTGTVITTGDSAYGTMLFNEKRQAIYIWELEESTKVECYDDCAEAWPPVLTDGVPRAAGNVSNKLLGTTKRTDGSTQVTYNGHPLYYYAHEGPGEVKCHNVSSYGGLWWAIRPNGIRAD